MHVSLSYASRALIRSPSIVRHVKSGKFLRGSAAEARKGAKALMDLQDELDEEAAGALQYQRFWL